MAKRTRQLKGDELERVQTFKKLVVIAMFSDDELMDRLVLKGGNALDLIHRISTRASADVDFSISNDFEEGRREEVRQRVERALQRTFKDKGYQVFDVRMDEKPRELTHDLAGFWGGYDVNFKVADDQTYKVFHDNLEELRKRAIQLGEGTKFLIDVSKYEYTLGKQARELDGYRIFVYSPEMMTCEKLRAICQQMPEYGHIVKRTRPGAARARDFLDIHTLVERQMLEMNSFANQQLLSDIFAAKRVPLSLLGLIVRYREFHGQDWARVVDTVKPGVKLEAFDFYFEYVLALVEGLQPLWDV
jgi:predicted nucleotidyltransferase component of viral defense system